MDALGRLAGVTCDNFQHQVIDTVTAFAGPSLKNLLSYTVPSSSALVITNIDVKTLYDTADALLIGGDFRATDDFNPYGPYVGVGDVGLIQLLVNDIGEFATAFDIGVINNPVLFVILGGRVLRVTANPKQPAAKNITLVMRLNAFIVPEPVGSEIKKKETRIITKDNRP
jgi:hypothetical protein